ncbi:MAG TPA: sigma 54-interacting transcriptional regulator [Kofleriaceae bacterium]|nr:sigma 54-interacting transcriptional regulator [Kofleriaceae bacterium]
MARRLRDDPTLSLPREAAVSPDLARVIVDRPGGPEVFPLSVQPIVIGKDRSVNVVLDDPHVSRYHVRLTLTARGVRVEDLQSRNGTHINGVRVEDVVLEDAAVLTLGLTNVRLELGQIAERRAFGNAIGSSPAMQAVFSVLHKLAPSEVSLLLTGETGTGKDVLARAIHEGSPRKGKPFAVFDCGAVAANLIESDLFGHDKGAFTGATGTREGVFERGNGGTVFLDEIGELPLELQPRLLRVIEQRQVTRVGGQETRHVDIRLVAATNRDLEAEVEAGRFRQDLFFRLAAAVVSIPPLRERLDDLPALVQVMLADLGTNLNVSSGVLAALAAYDWPGNVRELRNVIDSAVALADGPTLEPRHLLFFRLQGRTNARGARAETLDRLPLGGRALEMLERVAIKQTLEQTGGNKAQAARMLGIASSTLYEKLKKYDM